MLINSVPYREWLQTKQLKENRIFTTHVRFLLSYDYKKKKTQNNKSEWAKLGSGSRPYILGLLTGCTSHVLGFVVMVQKGIEC